MTNKAGMRVDKNLKKFAEFERRTFVVLLFFHLHGLLDVNLKKEKSFGVWYKPRKCIYF